MARSGSGAVKVAGAVMRTRVSDGGSWGRAAWLWRRREVVQLWRDCVCLGLDVAFDGERGSKGDSWIFLLNI